MATIICLEDDPDIAELVRFNLDRAGHSCRVVGDGKAMLDALSAEKPDLALLDIMVPRIDGLQVCRQIRSDPRLQTLPVLMLTAKGEEADVIKGLEAGADDYVVKPFSPRELLARIAALLRRSALASLPETRGLKHMGYDGLEIDTESHEVRVEGETLTLTLSEFRLLSFLARNPDKVFTRNRLLDEIAGTESFIVDRNVDVHIRGVRKKIGRWAQAIVTIRGIGYKFVPLERT